MLVGFFFFSQVLELVTRLSEQSHLCLQFYFSYLGEVRKLFSQFSNFLIPWSPGYTAVLYQLALDYTAEPLRLLLPKIQVSLLLVKTTNGLGWRIRVIVSFLVM